jgi:cyclophilin family peptidyl-prolyl cis-trans isomerase/HEAT repeat protein
MPRQKLIYAWILIVVVSATALAQNNVAIRIMKAEDERRWDTDLKQLLASPIAAIRKRAALAAGRIGNEDSVSALAGLLKDADVDVRAMAAFAIGEVEAASGADPLLAILKDEKEPPIVRARAIEALGKIAGAMPREQEARRLALGAAIIEALKHETSDRLTAILGLTSALRSRPANAGPTIAKFLSHPDARVRADAGNTLARLRLNDGNDQLRKLLNTDTDPIVRANAARVLGATEDKASFDSLLKHATDDSDSRVRVSAIRALALLKDARAAEKLVLRGLSLTFTKLAEKPTELNEILEIATTLGRLLPQKDDERALAFLATVRDEIDLTAPEIEIAAARISPSEYLRQFLPASSKPEPADVDKTNWRTLSAIAAGFGEIAALPDSVKNKAELAASAESHLRSLLEHRNTAKVPANLHIEYAIPDVLRAFAAFKPKNLAQVLFKHLNDPDVIVRGTAADLLGDLPPSEENTRALISALSLTENDPLNDAALSILDALGKQKSEAANKAITLVLGRRDYLVRRRAVNILKANGFGEFSVHVGIVQTKNTTADYRRALARVGKKVHAVVTTTKGSFTMELLPEAAPLTVDNFVQLAQRAFFNGITIHRVVPNFVIQDGDPRGDGNGGPPNHQIRCEINEVPYERAAVGMALSGKDTGSSQWFVTHSPQPHLDGGYTVFGRVIAGMNVVDNIVRGDVIKSIVIR